MSSHEDWQLQNGRSLSAMLEWIRGRLARISDEATPAVESGEAEAEHSHGRAATAPPAWPPAVQVLADRFGLSDFDCRVLALCAAAELDPGILPALAAVDSLGRPVVTFALCLALMGGPEWGSLSPWSPLRRWKLIELQNRAGDGLLQAALRIDERILHFLKGLNVPDERLGSALVPLRGDRHAVSPRQDEPWLAALNAALQGEKSAAVPWIQLMGAEPETRRELALQLAQSLRLDLFAVQSHVWMESTADVDALATLWERECRLLPVALLLEADSSNASISLQVREAMTRLLDQLTGVVIVGTALPLTWETSRPSLRRQLQPASTAEQRDIWSHLLPAAEQELAGTLSGQFYLSAPAIHQVATALKESGQTSPSHWWQACVDVARPQLAALASHMETRAGWSDLVLPEESSQQLRSIVSCVRQRGRVYGDWGFADVSSRNTGVSVLFSGESGTGKTLAAEVLASELQLDLFRIDLSGVISKYIGETEKNLARIFDAAEAGGAILLFDEADALFGKRSEVKDSHDRYANIEVNFLLQRMESFRGVSILTTNLKDALDSSFLRRLRYVVSFPFPSATQREAIWRVSFPKQAPRAELDFARLSRLPLTGGSIRNLAVDAAFRAAAADRVIDMELLQAAAQAEFLKLGRPYPDTSL